MSKFYDIYAKENGSWVRKGKSEGGECSGDHIIEVEQLPTENIDTSAIYNVRIASLLVSYNGETVNVNELGEGATVKIVSTRPTENIESAIYIVEDENTVLIGIVINGKGTLLTLEDFFGFEMVYSGEITDLTQAVDGNCYLYYADNFYRYENGAWANYIVPKGTFEIAKNGTIDVTKYSSVTVETPEPFVGRRFFNSTLSSEGLEEGTVYPVEIIFFNDSDGSKTKYDGIGRGTGTAADGTEFPALTVYEMGDDGWWTSGTGRYIYNFDTNEFYWGESKYIKGFHIKSAVPAIQAWFEANTTLKTETTITEQGTHDVAGYETALIDVAGGSGNIVPLTAKQNGTYTYTYETATETIDVNTQWEFTMPDTNDLIGFKKATNFIVPKSIEDVSSKLFYMTVPQEDGTIKSVPFDEISQENGFVTANMVLAYVADATLINEGYGTTYFENNTIYLTNIIWVLWAFSGVEMEDMPPITVTFASKLIENASFYPVTVDVQPDLKDKTITSNGTYNATDDGAEGYSKVIADVPTVINVAELPTANIDARSVYEMDGALYKLNTAILKGAWTIAENPLIQNLHNKGISEVNVNFTCNGVEYTRMGIFYDNIDYKLYYSTASSATEVYDTQKGSWTDSSYRFVEFTDENADVLAWLNGNGSAKTSGEWVEYIKPEGQLNVLKNNTTYDVSKYAEVRIATAQPYEVPLESLMNNIISNISQATIGNVYKYTGETTDTYEKNALYQLFEDEKTSDKYLKKLVISSGGGSTNLPLAYTVSSVDELPSDAPVGSLAKVKAQHSFYGEYWLSPTISMPYNLFEGVFFECDGFQYKTVIGYGALQYESVTGNQITVYENDEWIDEKYRHLKVKSGENTAFKVWLNENRENFQGAETWEFYEAERYANGIKWYIIDPNRVSVVQE